MEFPTHIVIVEIMPSGGTVHNYMVRVTNESIYGAMGQFLRNILKITLRVFISQYYYLPNVIFFTRLDMTSTCAEHKH